MGFARIATIIMVATLLPVSLGAQGRPAGVQTEVVAMHAMTETVRVFGQIVAVRQSSVATRVAGVISNVPVQVGMPVKAGDVLAQMDTSRLQIELESAEAQLGIATAGLEVAQAQANRAEKAFERARDLTANASISGAQLDDRASALAEAQGGIAQAQARIASAENAIELATYNLTNATVRAPFAGIVLETSAQPGQFASAGSQIATLLDNANMEVEANIPARLVSTLPRDQTVVGKTGDGEVFSLVLRAALPTEFSETRTRPVRFKVTESNPDFAIGQPVTLEVPVGEAREVLAVPKDALVQARGGWTAFVNIDGKASPRTVEIGAAVGDKFEVISGLAPGDEVVVRGNERLRPGQDIAPMGQGRPEAAPSGKPTDRSEKPASDGATSGDDAAKEG